MKISTSSKAKVWQNSRSRKNWQIAFLLLYTGGTGKGPVTQRPLSSARETPLVEVLPISAKEARPSDTLLVICAWSWKFSALWPRSPIILALFWNFWNLGRFGTAGKVSETPFKFAKWAIDDEFWVRVAVFELMIIE